MTFSLLLISVFTFVELNCENLFDCRHDSLKNDTEFLPEGSYHWTPYRYWRKLDRIGQTIIACGEDRCGENLKDKEKENGSGWNWKLPDLVALCEVENDSVLRDLTKRSLLRNASYEYVMTQSADERGIDVALLYSPYTFWLLESRAVSVQRVKGMRPTRDVLYAKGLVWGRDTLHVMVAHFPSRRGGEAYSRPFRMAAAKTVCALADSIKAASPNANIIIAGDFNDYSESKSLLMIRNRGFTDISADAKGHNGAKGTYRYQGEWGSLDHILVSPSLASRMLSCCVYDAPFLLVPDEKFGGVKPRRNYLGPRYMDGFSDHLPLVAKWRQPE